MRLAHSATAVFSMLHLLLVGCSAPAVEADEAGEAEGALLGEAEVLGAFAADLADGPTLDRAPRGVADTGPYARMNARQKQERAWSWASHPEQLRCSLGGSIAGESLVAAMTDPARCPVAKESGLPVPTIVDRTLAADTNIMVSLLSSSGLLSGAFDNAAGGDEMQRGRKKLFHPYGSTAKVELRMNATARYAGVLSPGTTTPGLARISGGGPESIMGFVPGMGVKLFTDSGPSVDFHVMNGMRPQVRGGAADYNVFARPFSNEFLTDGPGLYGYVTDKAVSLLGIVQPTPRFLPLDHLGAEATTRLSFLPNADLKKLVAERAAAYPERDFRVLLAEATKGASDQAPLTLYTVHVGGPSGTPGPAVGELVATSPFLPSKWGDRQLYFRHHRGCSSKGLQSPSPCRR